MGAFLGLFLGIGVLLTWQGLVVAKRPRKPASVNVKLREELAQAGLSNVTPNQLFAVQVLAAAFVFILGYLVTRAVSVSSIFAAFAAYTPRLLITRLRRRRHSDLRDLWPEVVDNLTSGVRAGLSLPEALSAIGDRGPEHLRDPFRRFGSEYRTSGKFNDALDRLKTELADPVGDRVCESLRVAREVGGTDLGRLLAALSGFLREDARTRSELLARQSWSVNAARMAVSAPWLVLLFLSTQKETLTAYDTPAGTFILISGAVLTLGAYRLMVRIGRLPEDKRVMR